MRCPAAHRHLRLRLPSAPWPPLATSSIVPSCPRSVLSLTTAHGLQSIAWLLVVVPAASAAILLLGGSTWTDGVTWLGALVPPALFVYSVALFFSVKAESNREVSLQLYKWIPVGRFQVEVGFLTRSALTGLRLAHHGRRRSLIHIYSLGYMEHDAGRRRFFGQFNLFIAAMLLLVLADNYLVLVRRLGRRRPRVVPADRLLLQPSVGGDGGQEGLHRQPGRRRRPVHRAS